MEWKDLTKDAAYTSNELMQRLLIEPTGLDIQGKLYVTNTGERFPIRGGSWGYGLETGLAALNLNNLRTDVYPDTGFRAAYTA